MTKIISSAPLDTSPPPSVLVHTSGEISFEFTCSAATNKNNDRSGLQHPRCHALALQPLLLLLLCPRSTISERLLR